MHERRVSERFSAGANATAFTVEQLTGFVRRSRRRALPYLVLPAGLSVEVSALLARVVHHQYDNLSLGVVKLEKPIEVILFSASSGEEQQHLHMRYIPSTKEIAETLARGVQVRRTPHHDVQERIRLGEHVDSMVAEVSSGLIRRSAFLRARLGEADSTVEPTGVRHLQFNLRVPYSNLGVLGGPGLHR